MIAPDDFEAYKFTTQAETEAIRRDVIRRMSLIEYVHHIQERESERRSQRIHRIKSALIAIGVSLALWGMIWALVAVVVHR